MTSISDMGSIANIVVQLAENAVKNIFTQIGNVLQWVIPSITQPIEETIADVFDSQCSRVKEILGVAYEQLKGQQETPLEKLTLVLRDPGLHMIYNITSAPECIPNSPGFNPAQTMYIFIHGFIDDPSKDSFSAISSALLNQGKCNVLALNGSSLIRWRYLRSTTYVRFIGERLGEVLAAMVHKGVDPSAIHVIGHSLGAHISSFTGKTFTNLTGKKVGRITGLDPARPCFSHVEPELRLKASDADFVDVIHTDVGALGLEDPVGQVDYFPNSGSRQPNCLGPICSHNRAWELFAESISSPDAFPALKCKNWDEFKAGPCEKQTSTMGFACQPGTTGLYFLQTRGESPYGLGKAGLTWWNN